MQTEDDLNAQESVTNGSHPIVFSTTDPLGRIVQLKNSTWNSHIIDGDHQRKEFVGQEETIKNLVSNPSFIVPDVENTTRERYFDFVFFEETGKVRPVMVVVDHENSTGDICTIVTQSRMRESTERGIIYVRK